MKRPIASNKSAALIHNIKLYGLLFLLLFILAVLVHQNFVVNRFPLSLTKKQQAIDAQRTRNQALAMQNQTKMAELQALTAADNELLESEARERFGLIKRGEVYYQIIHE